MDLERGPLATFQLLKLTDSSHRLVFTVQMIVCDGWSHYVVFEEISAIYSALVEHRNIDLPPAVPMRAFAQWQVQRKDNPAHRECREKWRQVFQTAPAPLNLPTARPRPPTRTSAGARVEAMLSPENYGRVKHAARACRSSSFAFLLAAFNTWIHRLSGATDIVVGVPFAAQGPLDMEKLVGQCANTLPLRTGIDPLEPFAGLVARNRDSLIDAQENWDITFGALAEELKLPADPSRIPLVSVLFNIDPPMAKVRFAGLRHQVRSGPRRFFQFDLGFNLVEDDGGLRIECDFNPDLFDAGMIASWVASYESLLEAFVLDPQLTVARAPMLPASRMDAHALTGETLPDGVSAPGTVAAAFERQASLTPDAVAVMSGDIALTYRDLEVRSRQLAANLHAHGVKAGETVALCVERTADLLIATLGILRSGCVLLPVDPSLPHSRIAHMLRDAMAATVLTDEHTRGSLPASDARVVTTEELLGRPSPANTQASPLGIQAENLAYIIYTSGSTGQPKGVEITHRALANVLAAFARTPGISSGDTMLAISPTSFDISLLELLLPITTGARTVIIDRDTAIDPRLLAESIARSRATIVQATPSTWRLLVNDGWTGDRRLRLLSGSEALDAPLAQRLLACGSELWNLYGPTETTIWSMASRVTAGSPVSLGRPIAHTTISLVDRNLEPVADGVSGEILIGGAGVARGYRNLPELTGRKFITRHPPVERVYRTGDLARRSPQGVIEFVGRLDTQVKICGCLVEPAEIESMLRSVATISDAAVITLTAADGQPGLVAYVVPASPEDGRHREFVIALRRTLRGLIPGYMIPSRFVIVSALPRTIEGKLDRAALPAPTPQAEADLADDSPLTATQASLAAIWREVLGLTKVGIHDNFFDLGGQSLRAVAVFKRIESAFGRRLPLSSLFRHPTIEQLAGLLDGDGPAAAWSSLVPIKPRGSRPPLFLVHGAGGNVLLYRALATHLDPEIPLYGLQSQGLDGHSTPLGTIEAMAEHYLREIRAVQPAGPYYIGGYCLGGTVAYHMAQLLQAKGERVELLALLDTYNFSRALKSSMTGFLIQKARFHLANLVRLRPRHMWDYLREKSRIARDGEFANLASSRPGHADGVARAAEGVEATVQAINDKAAEDYLPAHYPGVVTLFKPQINYKFYPDPKMGWGDLVGGLATVELPMNPHAMLVEPFVATLAAALTSRIPGPQTAPEQTRRPSTAARDAGPSVDLATSRIG